LTILGNRFAAELLDFARTASPPPINRNAGKQAVKGALGSGTPAVDNAA
jgi:hypothetical protein